MYHIFYRLLMLFFQYGLCGSFSSMIWCHSVFKNANSTWDGWRVRRWCVLFLTQPLSSAPQKTSHFDLNEPIQKTTSHLLKPPRLFKNHPFCFLTTPFCDALFFVLTTLLVQWLPREVQPFALFRGPFFLVAGWWNLSQKQPHLFPTGPVGFQSLEVMCWVPNTCLLPSCLSPPSTLFHLKNPGL